jgi:acyl-CoA synthetase (AMP-forming)/AMP-acid ligase II
MNLAMLVEMAAEGFGSRIAYGPRDDGLTYEHLLEEVRRAASLFVAQGAERVALVGENGHVVPLCLFGAGLAGVPYVPLNYRLSDDILRGLVAEVVPVALVADPEVVERLDGSEAKIVVRDDFVREVTAAPIVDLPFVDPEDVAILLFTSGTTSAPKAAVLRHRHLVSYIFGSVEFGGAGEEEAALVSVPPYHIAGVAALLSSIFAGRRVVHLAAFDPRTWIETVQREQITHAMVVPTMLGRIVDELTDGENLPSLRTLSYGGGRMPFSVIERAMEHLPRVDFVNAYGLTETSSTIAVLGPDDHRTAFASADEAAHRRLGSVGRPLPSIEIEVRDADGRPVAPGELGEIWVRGEQVSGEYVGKGRTVDDAGWFHTNDEGMLDADGYLFVEGRLDDVIVRGGENMSPGEIEDTLLAHHEIRDCAVIGAPDDEWGEKVVAFVVPDPGAALSAEDVRSWVKARLRSSRTPEEVVFVDALPYNETGKLLRRELRTRLPEEAS